MKNGVGEMSNIDLTKLKIHHLLVLAFIISLPSLAMFPGSWLYLPVGINFFVSGFFLLTQKLSISQSSAWRMVFILIVWLFIIFLIGNVFVPAIDQAGDRDDALNIAVTELIHGRYPYYPLTHMGNPISPLPGALILALPFVLLGNSGYQNFFWLIVFVIVLRWWLKDTRSVLLFLLFMLLSPMVFLDVLFGGDFLANNLYIAITLIWWLCTDWQNKKPRILLPIIFGSVALASRPNFFFWLPIIFVWLSRRTNVKNALIMCGITFVISCVLILPLYIYDPIHFSPMHALNKIDIAPSFHSSYIIVGITTLAAIALSFITINENDLLRNGAIIQAIPVLLTVGLCVVTRSPYIVLNNSMSYAISIMIPAMLCFMNGNNFNINST